MNEIPDHAEERAAIHEFDAGFSREKAEEMAHIYPEETVLFSIEATDDNAVNSAREWIKYHNLTNEDVSLRKSETSVYVKAKRKVYVG